MPLPYELPLTLDPVDEQTAANAAATGTVRNLLLDTNWDLAIIDGNIALAKGAVALEQSVRFRLQVFRGEWFLGLDEGVPYFEDILVKNPNLAIVRSILRDRILETPGILDVTSLSLDFDPASRTLSVDWEATSDLGELRGNSEVGL